MTECTPASSDLESNSKPLFLRQLSPEMLALVEQHFWCDFSDLIPAMKWDRKTPTN